MIVEGINHGVQFVNVIHKIAVWIGEPVFVLDDFHKTVLIVSWKMFSLVLEIHTTITSSLKFWIDIFPSSV